MKTATTTRGRVAIGLAALLLLTALGIQLTRSECRWGTFAYTVGVLNPTDQEDRRKDAAILVEGQEHIVTSSHDVLDVAISPDGERVVAARGRGEYSEVDSPDPTALYIYDVDGSNEELLTEEHVGTRLEWSPSGEEVAFVRGRAIRTVHVGTGEGREVFRLPRSADPYSTYVSGLAWSGDSARLAFFVTHRDANDSVLWTSGADGSERRRIARIQDDVFELDWSPDGETFAWGGSYKGVFSVMIMSSAGGEPEQVEPNSSYPVWSADGDELAYVIGHEGHYARRIVVGDGEGEGERAVPIEDDARWESTLDGWASC